MTGLNKHTGQALATVNEHIKQSIGDILTTPVGSRVMRREYGSLIPELIDQPLNEHTLLRLYAASAAALMRWEPRLKLTGFSLQIGTDGSATVEVVGTVNSQPFNSAVSLR